MRQKILLTGSTGFIGKNLKEYLEPRYELYAPPRKELELTDKEAVKDYLCSHPVDVVIHAATNPGHRWIKNPQNIAKNNVSMFFNLAECDNYFSRMIVLGSGSEYDIRRPMVRIKEEDMPKAPPEDEGGYSKFLFSQYAEKNEKIINLRSFGVFGKYEAYQIRFISNVICKALYEVPLTIKQNRVFSYLYVDDLCRIVEMCLFRTLQYRHYNVAPDEVIDLFSIAQLVNEVAKKDLEIIVKQPGWGKEYTADNSRLKKELGDVAFTPLREAIASLYQWYHDHRDVINYEELLFES